MRIPIRALQHFLYCPHRWGILYREGLWEDNFLTVIADLAHERVHSGDKLVQSKNKISISNVSLYSRKWDIYGKADCIELIPDSRGVNVAPYPGTYSLTVVEYKPTAPKEEILSPDRLQLFAQSCCVEEIFGVRPSACFYYANTRKRVKVDFDGEDERLLEQTLIQMNHWLQSDSSPLPVCEPKCNGCSMRDKCLPKQIKRTVRSAVLEDDL
ncbi:MAG: CRISPR-associated protein Cas4 [Firmicutes bacterium]|nr:CRISPR-associated protein Cas4 [Bacillota bacterium]